MMFSAPTTCTRVIDGNRVVYMEGNNIEVVHFNITETKEVRGLGFT